MISIESCFRALRVYGYSKPSYLAFGISLAVHIAFLFLFAFNMETELPEPQIVFPVILISETSLSSETSTSADTRENSLSSEMPPQSEPVEKKTVSEKQPDAMKVSKERLTEDDTKFSTPAPPNVIEPPENPLLETETEEVAKTGISPAIKPKSPPLPAKKPFFEQEKAKETTTIAESKEETPQRGGVITQKTAYEAPPLTDNRLTGLSSDVPASKKGPASPTKLASLSTEGAFDTPPDFTGRGLSNPAPKYPYRARQLGQEGRVVLRVQVNATGRATDIDLHKSSGHRRLDNAAIEAVRKWKFVPATRQGLKVAGIVEVPVRFDLNE